MWFPNPPHIYGGILCANPACEYMVSSNVRIRAYCCRQCHNCWLTHTYSAHKHDQNCEKTKPSDPWGVRAPPVPPMLSLPNPLLPSEDTVVKLDTQYENLIQYMQWVEGLEDEAQVDPPPVQDDPLAEQQDPPAQQQPASSSRPVIACLLCIVGVFPIRPLLASSTFSVTTSFPKQRLRYGVLTCMLYPVYAIMFDNNDDEH